MCGSLPTTTITRSAVDAAATASCVPEVSSSRPKWVASWGESASATSCPASSTRTYLRLCSALERSKNWPAAESSATGCSSQSSLTNQPSGVCAAVSTLRSCSPVSVKYFPLPTDWNVCTGTGHCTLVPQSLCTKGPNSRSPARSLTTSAPSTATTASAPSRVRSPSAMLTE